MLECVANVAEGRSSHLISGIAASAGPSLRDVHRDADHHRSVFTLIDEATRLASGVRSLADEVFSHLDLRTHHGAHPRLGVLDVVPFVALAPSPASLAVDLRDETARWIASTYGVPVFLYGPLPGGSRSLPEIRRGAFATLSPDYGPAEPHPRLGASCVGARPLLVAWNLWLRGVPLSDARRIATALRRPAVRALAFSLGEAVQVSCNVIDVDAVGLGDLYDEVLAQLPAGGSIDRAELVGLAPRSVLSAEDPGRWEELGLSEASTIEARLAG